MPISDAKLTANRANAAHSTGPTSDGGKAKSSQNATTHGLTGGPVVLPTEDMSEFQRFSVAIIASLEPEDALEQEFAEMVANALWRLKRAKPIEEGLLNTDPSVSSDPSSLPKNALDRELIAKAFMDHGRSLANLSSYEHRLYRNMKDSLKQLQTLQAARDRREQKAQTLETMRYYREDFPYARGSGGKKPVEPSAATGGFVFPKSEIAVETEQFALLDPVQPSLPDEKPPLPNEKEEKEAA